MPHGPNSNKGLTKAALARDLEESIGFYCAQYGQSWPLDVLADHLRHYYHPLLDQAASLINEFTEEQRQRPTSMGDRRRHA